MHIPLRAPGTYLLAFSTTILFTAAPRAQQDPQLLSPVHAVPAKAADWVRNEKALDKAFVRSEFVRIDAGALRRINGPKFFNLGLRLFGKDHVLEIDRTKNVLGHHVLFGKVRGRDGHTVLVLAPNDVVYGTIHMVEESYVLVNSTAGDVHVLQQLDESKRKAPCACCEKKHAPAPIRGRTVQGAPENPNATLLDVALFYTPKTKRDSGGQLGAEAICIGGIEQANSTNVASGVNVEFRVVVVAETKYTENGSSNDLGRFRATNDGYMDDVHKVRETYGADMMHLITSPTQLSYCGVAYLMTNLSSGFARYCFGVTVRSCVGGNVVAHELGHNMGCHHDRANAGGAVFPHAYGFRTADKKFRTVMAYSPGARVNLWSSPNNKHQTYVMGKTNSEDNVSTIAKTKTTISKFRAAKAVVFCQTQGAKAGKFDQVPQFFGRGTIGTAFPPRITISRQWYFSPGLVIMGASDVNVPYLGGILVPAPQAFLPLAPSFHPIELDASGLSKLPKNATLWMQVLFADAAAVQGVSATNGVKIVIP